MFNITKVDDRRLDLFLDGKLDKEEMRVALDDLIEKSEGVENGRMLYRIEDFEFPTLGAMAVEFSRLPSLFKMVGKFDRCAVLVDQGWVAKVSEFEGALIPGLDIKAFKLAETAEAEAWLAKG